MKLRQFTHYFIVDFVRCTTKTTVEIDDCSTEDLQKLCIKTFRGYMVDPKDGSTGTKIKVRLVKRDGSVFVYGTTLYRKTPIQFRKMLENAILQLSA